MDTDVLSNLIIDKIDSVSTIYTEENATAKRRNRQRWALVIKYEAKPAILPTGRTIFPTSTTLPFCRRGAITIGFAKRRDISPLSNLNAKKPVPTFLCFLSKTASRFIRRLKKWKSEGF